VVIKIKIMSLNKVLMVSCFCLSIFKIDAQQIPEYLDCVKINHLYRKACHNCFQHSVINTFSAALNETRVVELDIHSHKHGGNEASSGVWYVRHSENTNNSNNCVNTVNGQDNQDFGICLENLQDWSWAHPGHDPIIVFVDLKPPGAISTANGDFFRPNHSTTDLDNVFKQFALQMGGLDMIYKPSDLKGNFSSPREAAQNENWPSLGNLKNKIIFVLTGANSHLHEYVVNLGGSAMAFIAVKLDVFSNISNGYRPQAYSFASFQEVAFYNLNDGQTAAVGQYLELNGFMSRVWDGHSSTSASQYGGSIAANMNNIAIKNIYANNLNTNMNGELTNIHYVTTGGTTTSPQYIKSQYNSILQSALIKVTAQNLIIEAGTHYNIRAGEEVDLLPGVDIRPGSNTDISIGNCIDYSVNLRPTNTSGGEELLEQQMEHLFIDNQVITKTTDDVVEKLVKEPFVYPNPTTGVFNVDISRFDNSGLIEVYNIIGKKVFSRTILSSELVVNLINQPKGIYLVKVTIGGSVFNEKIIHQ